MRKPDSFGQYIKAMREQRGMSGRQLAKQIGVANTTIMDIENGSTPHPDLFVSLVDALELDVITAAQLMQPYRRIYEQLIQTIQKDEGV